MTHFALVSRAPLLATLAWLAVTASPRPCRAQLEFATETGFSAHSGDLMRMIEIREGPISPFAVGTDMTTASFRYRSAFIAGMRLTFWPSGLLGIEGEVSYMGGTVEQTVKSTLTLETLQSEAEATLTTAMARAVIRLGLTDATDGRVVGGIGLMKHGGDAWDGVEGTTTLAWMIGSGIAIRLGRHFAFQVDVLDRMSSPDLRVPGFDGEVVIDDILPATHISRRTENRLHHDIVIVPALSITLVGGDE